MTSLTKASQRRVLGQGLALGAIMLEIPSLTGNKTSLELDFRRAWRGWNHKSELPSVKAGPAYDDVFHVLHESSGRTRAHLAYWAGSWPFVPTLTVDDWTAGEIAEVIHDDIPAEAWTSLVQAWLDPAPRTPR